jgi:hypothetical protein
MLVFTHVYGDLWDNFRTFAAQGAAKQKMV